MDRRFVTVHSSILEDITTRVEKRSLPHALLISGEPFQGRMSLILELGRLLSCTEKRSSSCGCTSCRHSAYAYMSNVIYLGNRDHQLRIESALNRFEQEPTEEHRQFIYRELQLMLDQFHPLFTSSTTKNESDVTAASELHQYLVGSMELAPEDYTTWLKEVKRLLKALTQRLKSPKSVTIDHIRSLQKWVAQPLAASKAHIIILENIESSTEGARNSLLKFLEEPTEYTYIILLSEHPYRLLPTILSRVQHIQVPPLRYEDMKALHIPFNTMREYVYHTSGFQVEFLHRYGEAIAHSLVEKTPLRREDIDELSREIEHKAQYEYLMQTVLDHIRASDLSASKRYALMHTIQQKYQKSKELNQGSTLFIEGLVYNR